MAFKELLYYLFIINLLQFSLAKAVEKSSPSKEEENNSTPKDKLLEYYENELNILSKEYCVKAKNISEYILKDETIKYAQTPKIQEFKKNITEFLNKYNLYSRYGNYYDLVAIFADTTIYYFPGEEDESKKNITDDASYIKNLLEKLGYNEMDNNYENKYSEFIANKFNNRCEEYKSQLNKDELKKKEITVQWCDALKACKDYTCQLETFSKFPDPPRVDLVENISKSIIDIYIYYSDKAINISNKLLNDDALLQANTSVIQEFKKNITEFTKAYNSNHDAYELPDITELYSNTTTYYFDMPEVKLNTDSNLIVSVLRKLGAEQLEKECEEKFNDLVVKKFADKFEEFKSQLDKEELQKEKPLLDWYEELKTRKTSVSKALDKLYAL